MFLACKMETVPIEKFTFWYINWVRYLVLLEDKMQSILWNLALEKNWLAKLCRNNNKDIKIYMS